MRPKADTLDYRAGVLVYAVALLFAVAVVILTDGTFARLADLSFERVWLLAVGLGLQIVVDVIDLPPSRYDDVGLAILLLSYVAVLGFIASNIRTRGILVMGIGIALNAFVIALNAGMPYHVVDGLPRETTVKHRPERGSDVLPVLSDRFATGSPFRAAISIGDLVLFAGIVELAYAGSRRARRSPRIRSTPPRYVDLPAEEQSGGVIDLREPQAEATTRSSATSTLGS